MQLLTSFVNCVHFVVRGAAGAANGDKIFLIYFMGELGKFAFLAAHILHNEFVQMFLHVSESVLTLDNSCAFRIGSNFNTEEF